MTASATPPESTATASPSPLRAPPTRGSIWRRDLVAAVLWVSAVIPSAIGYWLVAGSLAGVPHGQLHTLLLASLLALAIATLLQVAFGFRLPIYEGPASAYLAALTVVTAEGHHQLPAIAGGLLAAGAFVVVLGLVGVDRLMARAFTPLVANVFLLTVTLAVIPATFGRAIDATHGLPGSGVAWAATAVVVIVTLALRRFPRLRPYSLLGALIAGTAVHLAIAGIPDARITGGVARPSLFPWGSPTISAGVVVPFLLAGGLAAFNTIASGHLTSAAYGLPITRRTQRRAFVMHGTAQVAGALLGNAVGTVSRLDSVPIVRLLDHRGRSPLLLAGVLVGALALVRPVIDLVAALPLSVSGAMLGMLLVLILASAVADLRREPWRVNAFVVVPALVPTAVWIAVGSSLPPAAQLIANPMLWGVLLGMVLERLIRPSARFAPPGADPR